MRSFWRFSRWIGLLAVPKLWSSRPMMNSIDGQEAVPLVALQNSMVVNVDDGVNQPKKEKIISEQEEKHDNQSKPSQKVEEKNQIQEIETHQQDNKSLKVEDNSSNEEEKLTEKSNIQENLTDKEVEGEKGETKSIDSTSLKPGQALVSPQCPSYLLRYLELSGYEPIMSSNISDPLVIKNSRNDIMALTSSSLADQYYLQRLLNFMNPPQVLTTIDQASQLLSSLPKDNFLVVTYIPDPETYQSLPQVKTKSVFDNFTQSRTIDINKVEGHFVDYSYCSSSQKDVYVIARTKEVADFLKINTFNIGFPYVLNKTSKESGGQSNTKLMEEKYKISDVRKKWDFTKTIDKTSEEKHQINKMTHFYLNKIETEIELENKVRQIQMSGDKRKILLFSTQQRREQFHTKTQQILEKVARLQKDKVIIIKTSNQMAIKRVLKVEPDSFATIRLIDLHSTQQPLFFQENYRNNQKTFSRSKYRGPFKIQNLCDFVSSPRLQEYYQSKKKITTINTALPDQLLSLSRSVVLFEKEGCEGCKYTRQSLEQLKRIIQSLQTDNRTRKNLIYRFTIQDPQGLGQVLLRRYNIFNDNSTFNAPRTTPKLFYFDGGNGFDLDVQKSLNKLNQVKAGQSPEQADDAVIADIIERIRLISQSSTDK